MQMIFAEILSACVSQVILILLREDDSIITTVTVSSDRHNIGEVEKGLTC